MSMTNNGLSKLIEECGEVLQVVGKLLQYPDGAHPDGKGDLTERLENELADLVGAIQFVEIKLSLHRRGITIRAGEKLHKYLKWDKEEESCQE